MVDLSTLAWEALGSKVLERLNLSVIHRPI